MLMIIIINHNFMFYILNSNYNFITYIHRNKFKMFRLRIYNFKGKFLNIFQNYLGYLSYYLCIVQYGWHFIK